MRPSRRTLLQFAIVAAICTSLATITQAGDKRDSAQVFLRAAELTDIRSPGSPPFELDARVEIRGNDGKAIPGTYKLVWISASKWREELIFDGYSRLRVGGEGKYWQTRTIDYEPLQIAELSEALDFAASLRNEKSPGKMKTRKESGLVLDCSDSGNGLNKKEYCFDRSEGVLRLEQVPAPTSEPFTFDYSDFLKLGTKQYPGKIEVTAGKAPFADFKVERLAIIDNAPQAEFAPPSGASIWLTCSNPDKPRLIHQVLPAYPAEERQRGQQGVVVLYGVIAADGTLQNLQVLATPTRALADAALSAVRQWRYEPRRCDGIPTQAETHIQVVFALGRR